MRPRALAVLRLITNFVERVRSPAGCEQRERERRRVAAELPALFMAHGDSVHLYAPNVGPLSLVVFDPMRS